MKNLGLREFKKIGKIVTLARNGGTWFIWELGSSDFESMLLLPHPIPILEAELEWSENHQVIFHWGAVGMRESIFSWSEEMHL